MTDDGHDLVGVDEAARMLEVTPDRILVLVEEGLLEPIGDADEPRFGRGEVEALRELGG
jgi:hypothetical protein